MFLKMKHTLKAAAFTALVSVVGVAGAQDSDPAEMVNQAAATATETAALMSDRFADITTFMDATVEAQIASLDIPAGSVSVVKDGEIIFAKAYGFTDREKKIPATADGTLFRPGSISKLFTWTAVMQQVEEGKLDLKTDVNQYLKTFQIPATFDEPITLEHILTHTAGFEEGAFGFLLTDDIANTLPLREAMAKYIPRRLNKPGEYSAYSNYATALAGLIVENVSGIPFNEYIKQKIFDPLSMNNSSFEEPLPADLNEKMAVGYKRKMGVWDAKKFEIIASFGPAGALSSTATDMAKFMIAHLNNGELNGNRILAEETAKLMHSNLFTPDDRISSMAHGFYEKFINGRRLIGHGGDTTLFHSNLMIDKEANLGLYVSFMGDTGGQARGAILDLFYDHYFPVDETTPEAPDDFKDRAADYAGTYKFWRHNQSTLEKAFAMLGSGIQVAPTEDNTLFIAGFGAPRQFVEIDKDLFIEVDGSQRIAFGRDDNGMVQDMYLDSMTFMSASRAPAAESPLFKTMLPALAVLFFLTVWTGWIYRRKEYKTMMPNERAAIRFSMATSGVTLLFVISLVVIISQHQSNLLFNIPGSFKMAILLPDLAAILTIGMVYHMIKCWTDGYWRLGRRIHYTLVSLAGVFMVWFYYYWNVYGVQLMA